MSPGKSLRQLFKKDKTTSNQQQDTSIGLEDWAVLDDEGNLKQVVIVDPDGVLDIKQLDENHCEVQVKDGTSHVFILTRLTESPPPCEVKEKFGRTRYIFQKDQYVQASEIELLIWENLVDSVDDDKALTAALTNFHDFLLDQLNGSWSTSSTELLDMVNEHDFKQTKSAWQKIDENLKSAETDSHDSSVESITSMDDLFKGYQEACYLNQYTKTGLSWKNFAFEYKQYCEYSQTLDFQFTNKKIKKTDQRYQSLIVYLQQAKLLLLDKYVRWIVQDLFSDKDNMMADANAILHPLFKSEKKVIENEAFKRAQQLMQQVFNVVLTPCEVSSHDSPSVELLVDTENDQTLFRYLLAYRFCQTAFILAPENKEQRKQIQIDDNPGYCLTEVCSPEELESLDQISKDLNSPTYKYTYRTAEDQSLSWRSNVGKSFELGNFLQKIASAFKRDSFYEVTCADIVKCVKNSYDVQSVYSHGLSHAESFDKFIFEHGQERDLNLLDEKWQLYQVTNSFDQLPDTQQQWLIGAYQSLVKQIEDLGYVREVQQHNNNNNNNYSSL